jgi:hypothetical protein
MSSRVPAEKIDPRIPVFLVRFIQAYGVQGVINDTLTSKKIEVLYCGIEVWSLKDSMLSDTIALPGLADSRI